MNRLKLPHISTLNWVLLILGAIAFLLPPFLGAEPFFQSLMIRIALYALVGISLNIPNGYTGVIAVNQVTLFGLGAYVTTYLQVFYGVNPWIGMFAGIGVAIATGVGFLYPAIRGKLPPLFLCISSIAFSTAVTLLLLNWTIRRGFEVIGGAVGVFVPLLPESLINFQWHSTKVPYVYVIMIFLVIGILLTYLLIKSKFGYFFVSIRDAEDAAESLGVNTAKYKLLSMAVSAAVAAVAGTFFAQYILFVEPYTTMNPSFLMELFIVNTIGGNGVLLGPLAGSLLYMPVSETLRISLGGNPQFAGFSLIAFGIVLIVATIVMPEGVIRLVREKWKKANKKDSAKP